MNFYGTLLEISRSLSLCVIAFSLFTFFITKAVFVQHKIALEKMSREFHFMSLVFTLRVYYTSPTEASFLFNAEILCYTSSTNTIIGKITSFMYGLSV